MEFEDGKKCFVASWGELGVQWGISKTMGQIHALLLIAPNALTADEIIDELSISRGNAHLNLKTLIEWGIVSKSSKEGDRRAYYLGEKDIWKLFKQVLIHRKRKELDPMIETLEKISTVNGVCECSKEFSKMVNELKMFSYKADKLLDNLSNMENQWLSKTFMKMI